MNELAYSLLAEVIDAESIAQEELFAKFSVERKDLVSAVNAIIISGYVTPLFGKDDVYYIPLQRGRDAFKSRQLPPDNTDILF